MAWIRSRLQSEMQAPLHILEALITFPTCTGWPRVSSLAPSSGLSASRRVAAPPNSRPQAMVYRVPTVASESRSRYQHIQPDNALKQKRRGMWDCRSEGCRLLGFEPVESVPVRRLRRRNPRRDQSGDQSCGAVAGVERRIGRGSSNSLDPLTD